MWGLVREPHGLSFTDTRIPDLHGVTGGTCGMWEGRLAPADPRRLSPVLCNYKHVGMSEGLGGTGAGPPRSPRPPSPAGGALPWSPSSPKAGLSACATQILSSCGARELEQRQQDIPQNKDETPTRSLEASPTLDYKRLNKEMRSTTLDGSSQRAGPRSLLSVTGCLWPCCDILH